MTFSNAGFSKALTQMKELYQENPAAAERRFADLTKTVAGNNAAFLDDRFSTVRSQAPFLDFMLVDGEGRVKESWSSFTDLPKKKSLPTNMDLVKHIVQTGEPRYLFKAPRSDLLFYFGNDAEAVVNLHDENTGVMTYNNTKDDRLILASWMAPRKDEDHVPSGYAVGRITFWDVRVKSNERKIGFATPKQEEVLVVHSAYILRHPKTGKKVTLTPLNGAGVILHGGLTVDEKYGADRVEADGSYSDFVTGAMTAYANSQDLRDVPLVLLYKSKDRLEFVHSQRK